MDSESSMQIAQGVVVAMDYTLKGDDGEILDASEGRGPMFYMHGAGNIIPGLEIELLGLAVGDSKEVTVEAVDGYGDRSDAVIQTVPKDLMSGIDNLEVGMQLRAGTDDGETMVTVTAIGDGTVTVDGNHPMAGRRLHFAVTIVEVRDATDEEKEHGHAHGPDTEAHQ
jgi:FKBP-type peptidyl-prolyl cis-trans isomerase SlyD